MSNKWGKGSAVSGTSRSASAGAARGAKTLKPTSATISATANGSRKKGESAWPTPQLHHGPAHPPSQIIEDLRSESGRAKADPVNPAHYHGDYVMRIAEDFGLDKDACLFQVVKYVLRAGKKPDNSTLTDLQKAHWYLERKIAALDAAGKAGK